MNYEYEVTLEGSCYEGFFNLYKYNVTYERFNGNKFENVYRECSKKNDVVVALAYDPKLKEILLIEQFRVGAAVRGDNPWILEIVAGFMDKKDEPKEKTAIREIKEETGCDVLEIEEVLNFQTSPGGSASRTYLFLAQVDATSADEYSGLETEHEDIKIHRFSYEQVKKMLVNKQIDNSISIVALQYFFMNNLDK